MRCKTSIPMSWFWPQWLIHNTMSLAVSIDDNTDWLSVHRTRLWATSNRTQLILVMSVEWFCWFGWWMAKYRTFVQYQKPIRLIRRHRFQFAPYALQRSQLHTTNKSLFWIGQQYSTRKIEVNNGHLLFVREQTTINAIELTLHGSFAN